MFDNVDLTNCLPRSSNAGDTPPLYAGDTPPLYVGDTPTFYVGVAVEKTAYHFDRLYHYSVPPDLAGRLTEGCRVLVPFGGGGHFRQGVVFAMSETIPPDCPADSVKPVFSMPDDGPVFSREMIMLARRISETCFCTLFDAARAMLPAGLKLTVTRGYLPAAGMTLEKLDGISGLSVTEKTAAVMVLSSGSPVPRQRILDTLGLSRDSAIPERLVEKGIIVRSEEARRRTGDRTVRMVRIAAGKDAAGSDLRSPKQQELVGLLEQTGYAEVRELRELFGISQTVISALVKKGILEYYNKEIYRRPEDDKQRAARDGADNAPPELTAAQRRAYESILRRCRGGTASATLLYGVTGSGKTAVYMKLIEDMLAEGRGVIVMVPEIALTPQTIGLFRKRFGDRTALFHSGLSLGERIDEWKRVKRGEAKIAVGTRSAVFAPLDDIGLIIIDEEQEYTYKSESSPRYHARDAARFRCAYHKAALVLASATPSVESFYFANEGKRYSLEVLPERYGGAELPQVSVVDISGQKLAENVISPELRDALSYNLEHGRQSILLHNRRGYNTFVACRKCGNVIVCKSCSVSMTFHSDIRRLVCHYCGASEPAAVRCPYCGSDELRYAGQGTQRVETELERLFPQARLLRMDADTTSSRNAHSELLSAFSKGRYDIMIGTQMVAKGLDFENVTLAGVLLADQMLFTDDFRGYERAFSLLTQVVGRSGRGAHGGRAIIQTLTPEHPIISMAARQNYAEFYGSEIKLRRAMLYPPFSDICLIGFVGSDEENAREMSKEFLSLLVEKASREHPKLPLRVLGPVPASINRLKGKFRYRIILKCRSDPELRALISELLSVVGGMKKYSSSTVFADMNPETVM